MDTITRKSLLYKSKVNYDDIDYALNHVLGCAHGCLYPCYAFLQAQRFNPAIVTHSDWKRPRIVKNALELLEKDLKRIGPQNISNVHLCFTTDPFMYDYRTGKSFPEVEELTMLILFRLWNEGIYTTTLTKGLYPIDWITRTPGAGLNSYGVTLVSLSKFFQKRFEPYSAPFDLRLERLRQLHLKGLRTWVSMEPFPTPNIDSVAASKRNTLKLLDAVGFVDKIIFGPWNYNTHVKEYDLENHGDFFSETAAKIKAYCDEREIEFYDKRESK